MAFSNNFLPGLVDQLEEQKGCKSKDLTGFDNNFRPLHYILTNDKISKHSNLTDLYHFRHSYKITLKEFPPI